MKQETTQTTAIAKIEALDLAIERGIEAQQMAGRMSKALAVAGAMADIRAAFTPEIMRTIMALQGTAIGFRSDKDSTGGYPENVVRDCGIEAMLQGVQFIGNQFNIIGGRSYITKEGMGEKLSKIAGLKQSTTPGIPELKTNGAIIPMDVEWEYKGVAGKRTLQICVRVNSGMGADAIIGKATRKARAWLYQHITGQEIPDGELDADGLKVVKGRVIDDKPSRFEPPKDAEQLLGEGVK
jgi:hypothetical protein